MENAKGKSIDPKKREKLTNVIGLRNILKKILWEKEKAFDFFIDVYIILLTNVLKISVKSLTLNKTHKLM